MNDFPWFQAAVATMVSSPVSDEPVEEQHIDAELKRQLGLNYRSAWRVKHKLMQVMVECESTRTLLDHVVIEAAAIHIPEVVGTGRRSTDISCFAWVNILLGNLKTALSGTYHAFKFREYAHRYLAEYQYRFNRRFNMKVILPRLLRAAATTNPRTESWLRLAEV